MMIEPNGTKKIPARTQVYKVDWCRKDFMLMSAEFREVRKRSKTPMESCFLCRVKFNDGDMMALACFIEGAKGNKTLCQTCAEELLATEVNA